jgi:Holliday junction resolvase-like predicted endonuclease
VGNGDRRNAALGGFGEELAAAHYRALICAKGATLVVCEVKARSGPAHGHPLEAVTATKQRRLRHLAAAYLRQQERRWPEVRFDVVSVLDGSLEVVEGAF